MPGDRNQFNEKFKDRHVRQLHLNDDAIDALGPAQGKPVRSALGFQDSVIRKRCSQPVGEIPPVEVLWINKKNRHAGWMGSFDCPRYTRERRKLCRMSAHVKRMNYLRESTLPAENLR